MKPLTIPDEMDALLALYAIDALDDQERQLVTAFLGEHPEARTEVAAYIRAASRLRSSSGPSPEVWARIAERIHADGHDPHADRLADLPEPGATVIVLDDHRRTRTGLLRIAAAAAAIASLAGTAAALSGGITGSNPPATTAPASSIAAQAAQALTAPGAQRGTVTAADGRASATLVVLPSGRGYVLDLEGHRAGYQLFALTPNGPVIVAVLGESTPIAFELPPGTSSLVVDRTPPDTTGSPGTTPGVPTAGGPGTPSGSTSIPDPTLPGGLASNLFGLVTVPTAVKP
jgi:hypothetical protein